ncbi:hypothetical protein GMRT_10263 [Giardia muris]|uniref:Elongin-C n=1 Tax=Giardia muris TaxID=5742 RepID=A0A4Z1SX91_GIAMU|nr:hypothetical protein GMRT_10263 [Giardia muris]|eukprot:TNJ29445.1 hypothetical protein GMRT_10263 [Giardia muris]
MHPNKLIEDRLVERFENTYPFSINPFEEQYIELHDRAGNAYTICKRAILQSPFLKMHCGPKPLSLDISPQAMRLVIRYLYYKLRYGAQVARTEHPSEIPVFKAIPHTIALEVADAAALLQI